jgi:D-serine dehydratase
MYKMLAKLADTENIYLEPSALAGMYGSILLKINSEFAEFGKIENCTHIVWATGGGMVPQEEMKKYYLAGK